MPPPGVSHPPSALETARRIAAGETTAVAEVDAAIARIEAMDKEINAVVVRVFDRARAEAKEADKLVKKGVRKPLLGVPFTVKEQFNIKGTKMTWGIPDFKDWTSADDGYHVKKLKESGAIVLGKTNVPVGLSDWQSVNPIYGRTVNPWNKDRSPGGSSGGSGAALAAGYVPLEVGSDIAGSIRVPSFFCGIVGHKPTHNIIPGENFPGTPGGAPVPLAVSGPMARTTDDVAVALDLLSAYPLKQSEITSLKGLKIFVAPTLPHVKVAKNISDAIEAAATRAEQAGAIIVRESPLLPKVEDYLQDYEDLLWITMTAGAYQKRDGSVFSAAEMIMILNRQALVHRAWAAFFAEHAALLMPVFPVQAFPHDDSPQKSRQLDVDGEKLPYEPSGFAIASWATYGNLPATAVPLGVADGLPVGVQVLCDRYKDHDAIKIAGMIMVPA
ncbi:amidase [Hyaloraphidium curvatum]|nr:amidase [Hyaloraphidium curvatum]